MYFTTLALATLPFLSLILSTPISQPETPSHLAARTPVDLYLHNDDEHQVGDSLEHVFDVISQIPESVLRAGDDAKNKWLEEHGHRSTKRDVVGVEQRDWDDVWDVTKCVGAIAAFIASNAIGAAKLLRIKKYIEALGGIREAAELLLKASTQAERLKEGGEFLALLAGEILGTSMVANNC